MNVYVSQHNLLPSTYYNRHYIALIADRRPVGILRTTNEEAAAWAKYATYKRDVLSKPWVLTDKEQRQAERRAQGYEAKKKAKEEHKRKKQALEQEKQRRAQKRAKSRLHAETLDLKVSRKRDDRHEPDQRPRREPKHRQNDV